MKEISHEKWMEMIKELNAGQPNLLDLVQQQIESYEKEKAFCVKGSKASFGSSTNA